MEKKSNDLIFEAVATYVKYGIKKGRTKTGKEFEADEPTYQISLKGDIPYEDITAYDDFDGKIPSWFKKQEGYMNLSSKFDVPVRRNGHEGTISGWLKNQAEGEYSVNGSEVRVKVRQKEGVIYPMAIIVLKDGEKRDPFADME